MDRSDPTYAELLGEPNNSIGGAIACLVGPVFMLLIAVASAFAYGRRAPGCGNAQLNAWPSHPLGRLTVDAAVPHSR